MENEPARCSNTLPVLTTRTSGVHMASIHVTFFHIGINSISCAQLPVYACTHAINRIPAEMEDLMEKIIGGHIEGINDMAGDDISGPLALLDSSMRDIGAFAEGITMYTDDIIMVQRAA